MSKTDSKSKNTTTINQLLQVFFDDENYDIGGDYTKENKKSIKDYYIYNKQSKTRCLYFSIHMNKTPHAIHVHFLKNCQSNDKKKEKSGKGSHTVQLLVGFATYLRDKPGFENTELIIDVDTSKIYFDGFDEKKSSSTEFSFPLSILYLLTQGETWYNSLGFYENNYEENYRKALEYINLSIPPMKKNETIQSHFIDIFDRIKHLTNKKKINSNEEKELSIYQIILEQQYKFIKNELFGSDKFAYLKYRF